MDNEERSKPPSSDELLRPAREELTRDIDPATAEAPGPADPVVGAPDATDHAGQPSAVAGDPAVEETSQQALLAPDLPGGPSTVRCMHCTDDVPLDMARCPTCGDDPRVGLHDRPAPPAPARLPARTGRGRAGVIGAVAIAVAVSTAIILVLGEGDAESISDMFLAASATRLVPVSAVC